MTKIITLNATALTRLAHAAAPGFAAAYNFAKRLKTLRGLTPYEAICKAWHDNPSTFSRNPIHQTPGPNIYVQAEPAATRTEIWERSGRDVNDLPAVMEVGELVDAALLGFDRREAVTIPPLPDAAHWTALEAARQAILPNLLQAHAAARYRAAA